MTQQAGPLPTCGLDISCQRLCILADVQHIWPLLSNCSECIRVVKSVGRGPVDRQRPTPTMHEALHAPSCSSVASCGRLQQVSLTRGPRHCGIRRGHVDAAAAATTT